MTLTELKYIVAVAQERNFGRAAEKCFVSQPTLSVAVKKLEDELGVTIFERQKNEVLITPVGEKIIAQAQKTREQAVQIKEIAKQGADPFTDVLRLGAIYTVGPYLFPKLIPALAKAAPDMPLMIHEDFTKNLTKRLLHGELDVIIIALPYQPAGIDVQPLYNENLKVVMPKNHAWHTETAIKPEALKTEKVLLLGEGHCFRDDVLRACPNCGIDATAMDDDEKMLEGGTLETIRHMVASGLGVSVLPETAVQSSQYSEDYILVKPFIEPQPTRQIALAYRHGYPRQQVVELLTRLLT